VERKLEQCNTRDGGHIVYEIAMLLGRWNTLDPNKWKETETHKRFRIIAAFLAVFSVDCFPNSIESMNRRRDTTSGKETVLNIPKSGDVTLFG
jgi:hypothetical protein